MHSTKTSKDQRLRYTLIGVLPTLIWGTAVGIAGSLAPAIGAMKAAGISYLLAAAISLMVLRIRGGLREQLLVISGVPFFICGLFFFVNVTTFWLSIGLSPSKSAIPEIGLINFLWPTTTLLFSFVFFRTTVGYLFLPGVALAAIGVIIPIADFRHIELSGLLQNACVNPSPYWLALLAALSWGVYSNLTRKWERQLNSAAPALYLALSGTLLLLMGILTEAESTWSLRVVLEILFIGVTDAVAFVSWDAAMRKGDQIVVAAIANFTPFLSIAFAILYLDIPGDAQLWLGCLLVVAGTFIAKAATKSVEFSTNQTA